MAGHLLEARHDVVHFRTRCAHPSLRQFVSAIAAIANVECA